MEEVQWSHKLSSRSHTEEWLDFHNLPSATNGASVIFARFRLTYLLTLKWLPISVCCSKRLVYFWTFAKYRHFFRRKQYQRPSYTSTNVTLSVCITKKYVIVASGHLFYKRFIVHPAWVTSNSLYWISIYIFPIFHFPFYHLNLLIQQFGFTYWKITNEEIREMLLLKQLLRFTLIHHYQFFGGGFLKIQSLEEMKDYSAGNAVLFKYILK